ncbi:spanin [Pseudoalteromonas phage RIO-1]|uniref:Spanin n=1 Tax=Pseudoalteromonas phage RIO-1 TaxID=1316739 RepID=R4JMX4_9CAUD|nr:spanin [Pseudoalteromonas phage RIO-1]AGK87020.1 spanin [Pseudoalteromonas phage RIO-1]
MMLTQGVLIVLLVAVALVLAACAVLTFVRFSLNASKWEGFWTLSSMLNALRITSTSSEWYSKGGKRYTVQPYGTMFVVKVGDKGVEFCDSLERIRHNWEDCYTNYWTKFETKEEAEEKLSKVESLSTKTEVGDAKYLLYLVPIAAVLDVIWYLFCMSPVATVSVVSTVVLTFSTRWLSGKLSDTVSKTKENTDDIKVLKSKQK